MKNFKEEFEKVKDQFERVEAKARVIRESDNSAEKKIALKDHTFELSQLRKGLRVLKTQLIPANNKKIPNEIRPNVLEVLRWERQRKLLGAKETYLLNELEFQDILKSMEKEDSPWRTAVCRNAPPAAYYLETGDEFYYREDYNEASQKNYVTFYVEVIKEPEEQITKELERKMKTNYVPVDSDFPPEKKLYKRFVLSKSEFGRYFIDQDYAG